MKNERFERYIYTGVTAILVLIAAVFVVFLFLERSAVFAFLGKVRFVLCTSDLWSGPGIFNVPGLQLVLPADCVYRKVRGAKGKI